MRKINLNLEEVKNQILSLKGREVEMNINRGRKKYDTIIGTIENAYPSVFTINSNQKVQTFSYFDVLCGIVEIKDMTQSNI